MFSASLRAGICVVCSPGSSRFAWLLGCSWDGQDQRGYLRGRTEAARSDSGEAVGSPFHVRISAAGCLLHSRLFLYFLQSIFSSDNGH